MFSVHVGAPNGPVVAPTSLAQPSAVRGDTSLVQHVMRNRELQEMLKQDDPGNWGRFFGEHVEVHSACEDAMTARIVHTVVPQIVERCLPAFELQFKDAFDKMWSAQAERLEAVLRGVRPTVNINTSARDASDLEHINVGAENPEDIARLKKTTSPVTRFLREKWQPEWLRAGIRHTCVSLHFSVLMQARKTKLLQQRNEQVPFVGQINRAQPHYTVSDRDLMTQVFNDDLWPILKDRTCVLVSRVVPMRRSYL